MLLFDAHLDLAMNALEWNRDLRRELDEVRRRETGKRDKPDRGNGVVTLSEMRRGEVGICIATLIARYVPEGSPLPGWHSPEIAWSIAQGQLAWYQEMEAAGEMIQIRNVDQLRHVQRLWSEPGDRKQPIGYVLSLEGADCLVSLAHLERAYESGLRAVGPAHYGPGRYAPGTGAEGGLERAGRELLAEMQQLGMALDVTHLTDEAFWESLERFDGPLWASHNNCRQLVPHPRQLNDQQLQALFERDAVIGVACDAWMLRSGWVIGQTTPNDAAVKIETVVDHIDYICQLAGNVRHCGIGSDLDGGYGREQCPADLNSIADMQQVAEILDRRGYTDFDVKCIMHGNWLRRLEQAWDGDN